MTRRHRRLPLVCRQKGHAWVLSMSQSGIEVCARRNCDEQRDLLPTLVSGR